MEKKPSKNRDKKKEKEKEEKRNNKKGKEPQKINKKKLSSYEIINQDHSLKPFELEIKERMELYKEKLNEIKNK